MLYLNKRNCMIVVTVLPSVPAILLMKFLAVETK